MGLLKTLEECNLCPRQCGVNRTLSQTGYCKCNDQPLVSSVFLHKGEEPVISGDKGICNVFFAHCNLQCVYCQNYQISLNKGFESTWLTSVDEITRIITKHLEQGIKLVGFVSPSHQIPQMIQIIENLWGQGYKPTIIYNSNGYDSVESLKNLEDIVDVYLPDFKYYDNTLGQSYSDVKNYFDIASKALKEMYRQKGSSILLDDDGLIESGIIVRHLVLPGAENDSIKILEYIANEISPFLHISLMSQYFPTEKVNMDINLKRKLRRSEYEQVVQKFDELGFNGWMQELDSSDHYRPDFLSHTPFIDG
jgi:putative pyruvate formate lyase activating enzyme